MAHRDFAPHACGKVISPATNVPRRHRAAKRTNAARRDSAARPSFHFSSILKRSCTPLPPPPSYSRDEANFQTPGWKQLPRRGCVSSNEWSRSPNIPVTRLPVLSAARFFEKVYLARRIASPSREWLQIVGGRGRRMETRGGGEEEEEETRKIAKVRISRVIWKLKGWNGCETRRSVSNSVKRTGWLL